MSSDTKISKKSLITFRNYHSDDKNFILATWLNGLYLGNPFFKKINKDSFFKNYDEILKKILEWPETIVTVACLMEDPTVILGYSVMKNSEVLHWVFVKHVWRRIGIMRDLTAPFKIKTVTHLTKIGEEIKPKRISFDPFQI